LTKPIVVVAFVAALAGCGGSGRLDDGEAAALSALKADDRPHFYLGASFRGLLLTHVEKIRTRANFIYGDCTPTGGEQPSCSPPLEIQNKVCSRTRVNVAIYADRTELAAAAVKALRPLNRATKHARSARVSFDMAQPCHKIASPFPSPTGTG